MPSELIDRSNRDDWIKAGRTTAQSRAKDRVQRILSEHVPEPLPEDVTQELRRIMETDAKKYGLETLPAIDK